MLAADGALRFPLVRGSKAFAAESRFGHIYPQLGAKMKGFEDQKIPVFLIDPPRPWKDCV